MNVKPNTTALSRQRRLLHFLSGTLLSCSVWAIPSVFASTPEGRQELISDYGTFSALSFDGSYIAFMGYVDGQSGFPDVVVRDRLTNESQIANVSNTGDQADDYSWNPSISSDGRFVAFDSHADNLVEGDINERKDVFVRDMVSGTTTLISKSSLGVQGDKTSGWPSISANGRYVVFESESNTLVAGDDDNSRDIFIHDRETSRTERVDMECSNTSSFETFVSSATVSGSGRYVVAECWRWCRESGPACTVQIHVHDRQTGFVTPVSKSTSGELGNEWSGNAKITENGRYVVFHSSSDNLVPIDTNGVSDIFVHDQHTGETTRVSISSTGEESDWGGLNPAISSDGRYIVFDSASNNLSDPSLNIPHDYVDDVFIHDRQTHETTQLTTLFDDIEKPDSKYPEISGDGRYVTFEASSGVLSGESLYLYDRGVSSALPPLPLSGGSATNLSTRGTVSAATPMQGGIVVDGEAQVLVTARGPSTGLATALTDPRIDLFAINPGMPADKLVSSDDWKSNANRSDIEAETASRPLADREPALLVSLGSGSYSAVVNSAVPGEVGEVVVGFTMVTDDPVAGSARNLSTRGQVTPAAGMHGGIVVEGGIRVLITARGPSTGLGTALRDTVMTLYRLGGGQPTIEIGENDNWRSNDNALDITSATATRPLDDREAALLVDLDPGSYSAVVTGIGGDSGEVVLGFTIVSDAR